MTTEKKLTENERIKRESDYLRGHIAEALADASTGGIPADEQQLLKFLGATQQDDRDVRQARKKAGLESAYSFMVRLRLPGGIISPDQWLVMDSLADEYGNRTLKLTTRQSVQIHGVLKANLKSSLQRIHAASLSAIASSGDATRNVMVSQGTADSPAYAAMYELAQNLSRELEPRTHAYHEIWLDEKKVLSTEQTEPLYGATYLPRKFKIAFTLPPDNSVDVYTHDLGFVAITEGDVIVGYDVLAGGGMGCAYGNAASFPRIADVIGFCRPEEVEDVAKAVLLIHRDFSDRTDRKLSRLRYTIASRSTEWFRRELHARLGRELEAPRPFTLSANADLPVTSPERRLLFVEGGRVREGLKAALREIATLPVGNFLITGNQNLVLTGLTPELRRQVEDILQRHGAVGGESGLRRQAAACTSLPFCPMSFTDSERFLPELISELEPTLRELGLWEERITVRMTGCPNGCSRPYVAELAFVGRGVRKYNIWLGGAPDGSRLGYIWRESVAGADIAAVLRPVLERFAATRTAGESFGNWTFAHREEIASL